MARRRLLAIRGALEDVSPAAPDSYQGSPDHAAQRSHRPALALAELVLRRCSITSVAGWVKSVSFVFDMNKVFEDFLSIALHASLERLAGQIRLQYREERLDVQNRIRLIPDISWWRAGRRHAVIDAKYKRLHDERFPYADAYQMLGYCTALGLEHGYLVYAKDADEHARVHRVRNTSIDLLVRAVDVEQEPEMLLAEIDRLAAEIAGADPVLEIAVAGRLGGGTTG